MKVAQAVPVDELQEAAGKVRAYHDAEIARNCYRAANVLVVLTMIGAMLPLSDGWIWPVVYGVAGVVTILGIVLIIKKAISNGLVSLLFAWLILPAWIVAIPFVRTLTASGVKTAIDKTPAQRVAEGLLPEPITPSPEDGSIAPAKEWIRNTVINADAIKYQHWSTTEQGDQISTVVIFTTLDTHNEPVEERLKFVFNRYEKQPISVLNQKTSHFLFERPREVSNPTQQTNP